MPVTVLIIVGVALVVFGGLVLLRFPDRPGGKVGWQGMEVSSVGAGLPLILVGVVSVAFGAANSNKASNQNNVGPGSSTSLVSSGSLSATPGCLRNVFRDLPAARVTTIVAGASATPVTRPPQSESGPFGLHLTDDEKTVGGVIAHYVPAGDLFKIDAVVDASCRRVNDAALHDQERPSETLGTLQDYDTLIMPLGDRSYKLRLGIAGDHIEATSFTR